MGPNYVELSAQRYWKASQAWRRGIGGENWTYESLISELCELRCYRGSVALLAAITVDDVIHDQREQHRFEAEIHALPIREGLAPISAITQIAG